MTKLSLKNWWSHAFEKGIYPLKSLIEDPKWRKKTGQEIAFLRRILRLPKRSQILDVGCGVGRHAVELAKLGYALTGVDISSKYLAEARRRARKQGAHAYFIREDMRRLDFNKMFDAAINLFTSFGYFPSPSDDLKVLRGVCKALKPGGLFLLDTINGTRITHILSLAARTGIRSKNWDQLPDASFCLEDPVFLAAKRGIRTRWVFLANGTKREMVSFTRTFSRTELARLFSKAGFHVLRVFGDMKGSQYHPLKSPRLVVLARKPL